jgi:DNA-binding transcriptional ArsR family regulator
MREERRRHITEPAALDALAHPVRLELINFLMSSGPATASVCARAVGDTPSNCSYHLRKLAQVGLVAEVRSGDGRERPWQALVTGFDTPATGTPEDNAGARGASELLALSVQRDQKLARDYLARRDQVADVWRAADGYATYTLRMTPHELTELGEALDALIRPYIAAIRDDSPDGSALVHLGLHAFPTETEHSASTS